MLADVTSAGFIGFWVVLYVVLVLTIGTFCLTGPWKWGPLWAISIAFFAISVILTSLAIAWGATSKDVLIGVSTGLFTAVVVTVVVAIVEERREDAANARDRRLTLELAPSLDFRNLANEDLRGINLSGKKIRMADLQGANLAGADLSMCNLEGADLRGADLTDADVDGAVFARADLRSTKFIGASAQGANFQHVDVDPKTDFSSADLRTLWGEPDEPRRSATFYALMRKLMPPKTVSFDGAEMYTSDGARQVEGTLTAPKAKYDRNIEWPDFQLRLGPPPTIVPPLGAELDNEIVDYLKEVDGLILTADPSTVADFLAEEVARWKYKLEPLVANDETAVLNSTKDNAGEGWDLVGVIDLGVQDIGPPQHLIYRRKKDSDWTWLLQIWSSRLYVDEDD